jgi:NAD(P)-dependent dehydrogenase (short-subunit alcohol dehydrogenase family)
MAWTAARLPDLRGRTAVVTGANSGIGWQTAKQLAGHGARVVLACRDVPRAERAADRIRAAYPIADLEVSALDLASIGSIRKFGEAWEGPLDLLVNNAGVMAPPKRITTEDGFELQFGTNHLGHYVLTGLLLPALLSSRMPRVVTVSSVAHFGAEIDVVDGNAGPYRPQKAYSNSKLANLLFAGELQRRSLAANSRLISVAAHPGVAATGLVSDRQGMGANPAVRLLGSFFVRIFTQTSSAAARSSLFAASEAEPGSYTGPQRFGQSRGRIGPAKRSTLASDEELGRHLWSVSEDLTGFRYRWSTEVPPLS